MTDADREEDGDDEPEDDPEEHEDACDEAGGRGAAHNDAVKEAGVDEKGGEDGGIRCRTRESGFVFDWLSHRDGLAPHAVVV